MATVRHCWIGGKPHCSAALAAGQYDFYRRLQNFRPAWKTAQQEIGLYQTTSIPFGLDLAAAIQVFIDENVAAKQALEAVKERHAPRWQTKVGTYRIKQQLVLPDVRDEAGDVIMEDLQVVLALTADCACTVRGLLFRHLHPLPRGVHLLSASEGLGSFHLFHLSPF